MLALGCGRGTDHSTSQPNNKWISRSRSVLKSSRVSGLSVFLQLALHSLIKPVTSSFVLLLIQWKNAISCNQKSEARSRTLCNTLQISPSVADMNCTNQMREHRPCRTGPPCIWCTSKPNMYNYKILCIIINYTIYNL